MKRTMVISLSLAVLAVAACSSKEESSATASAATTSAEAPQLPADVASVSDAASTATPAAETATTAQGSESTIAATGEFVSPVRSDLAAKVIGRVAKLHVDEGSRVRRGQPLLELETDYLRLNLRAAEADAARARAAADEAQRDLARKQELIAKNSIPRATFDRSQAMYEQANAARAAAEAQAALLRQQLADSTVRSPIDGVIAEKRTDVGAKLGDGNVALVVLQTSPLKLRFRVPERYLGRIGTGDSVTAHVDPYPNESFAGTIKTVGGVIDPQTRTMFAEAEFPNRDGRLRPGLFARVEVKLD